MERLKGIVLFLMRGDIYRANLILWNYYGRDELYKEDNAKTLQLIGKMIDGKYTSLDDVKRSVNVITKKEAETWASYEHSKLDKWNGDGAMRSAEIKYEQFVENYGHLINFDLRFTGVVLDYHNDVLD